MNLLDLVIKDIIKLAYENGYFDGMTGTHMRSIKSVEAETFEQLKCLTRNTDFEHIDILLEDSNIK